MSFLEFLVLKVECLPFTYFKHMFLYRIRCLAAASTPLSRFQNRVLQESVCLVGLPLRTARIFLSLGVLQISGFCCLPASWTLCVLVVWALGSVTTLWRAQVVYFCGQRPVSPASRVPRSVVVVRSNPPCRPQALVPPPRLNLRESGWNVAGCLNVSRVLDVFALLIWLCEKDVWFTR